jgi:hypothetical protein
VRALQYALVLFLQAVLVVTVVAGARAFTHLDARGSLPSAPSTSLPAPALR